MSKDISPSDSIVLKIPHRLNRELENVVFQTAGIAQKYNCALKRLDAPAGSRD